MIGKSLSHFRILEKIGEGGMGVVYKAMDTKLGREVALKVLPEIFTEDPDRLARFEREARLLAALNHPNIAAIHGIEESDEVRFLVLELVYGETLAEWLAGGPLPVEEALTLSRQITEALEAAHEQGIIHRDLKPANVKVTPEGKVKVLDFGLAKAFEGKGPSGDISRSPTITTGGTRAGVILGTAAYMSPEQARGKPLDRRTDIWSFGCVLYETLTGRKAFAGETVSDTIARILEREADWEALPTDTPVKIRDLLRRCLQKDSHQRLRDIGDARIEMDQDLTEPSVAIGTEIAAPRPAAWRQVLPWVLLGVMAVVALWSPWQKRVPKPSVRRFTLNLPLSEPLWLSQVYLQAPSVALSADGTKLVYVASHGGIHQLYLRELDQFEPRPIPGTEDARNPFFSPDGEWVAFLTSGKLKKVSLRSGAVVTLCDVLPDVSSGGSWGTDGNILFAPTPISGLARIPADGGPLEHITTPDHTRDEKGHFYPYSLPEGKGVLFTVSKTAGWADTRIAALSLETGEWRTLIEGTSPHYLSTGHLVYAQAGALLAAPFDLERLEITGSPVRILDGVMTTVGAEFSVSADGSLVYLPGIGGWREFRLFWVDRQGEAQALALLPRAYFLPRLSPDGQHLALSIYGPPKGNSDIWVAGLARNTLTRLTFNPDVDIYPIWTPDGQQLTFGSASPHQPPDLSWKPADGTGAKEQLHTRENAQFPTSWSPNGRILLFTDEHPDTKFDILVLPLDGEGKTEPFLKTKYNETAGMFSPDGQWIAYQSDESGRYEVYVRPIGASGSKQQISTEGGADPVWARDGSELFYRNGDKMMVVAMKTDPEFTAGKPEFLFEGPYTTNRIAANYDITPDGQRFLMIKASENGSGAPTQINVVLNWFEELKRLVPPGR